MWHGPKLELRLMGIGVQQLAATKKAISKITNIKPFPFPYEKVQVNVYSLLFDRVNSLAHTGAVIRLHVIVHVGVVLTQIGLRRATGHSGESKGWLVSIRIHQLLNEKYLC